MSQNNPTLVRCINPKTGQVKYFPSRVVEDAPLFQRTGFIVQPLKTPDIPDEAQQAPSPVPIAEPVLQPTTVAEPKGEPADEALIPADEKGVKEEAPAAKVRSNEMHWRQAIRTISSKFDEKEILAFVEGEHRELVLREAERQIETIRASNK